MPRRSIALIIFLALLAAPSWLRAQDLVPDVRPAPLVRLTGVLEEVEKPRVSTFPVLSVWLGDKPRVFRVARVEPVIPAYPAEDRIREVSSLGLRFVGDDEVLATLQRPEMHDRSIVIEGWLRPSAGVLQVRSVKLAEQFQDER
ncbi:MAG TPA: hypothetical protein VGX03_19655 [Candidatus Binatia bacterium]|nr:hypothetical protein [Candidatus Binatia bacterium]